MPLRKDRQLYVSLHYSLGKKKKSVSRHIGNHILYWNYCNSGFMFLLCLKCVLSCLSSCLFSSYPSTALPTPNKKGKIREEKETRETQLICYCLYMHSEINMTRSATHRGHISWWWNSSAAGTDEEPLCCYHRSPQDRALLAFSSLTGRSCLYLGTFSHFQFKHDYYWEFLPISAYSRLTFLLVSSSCLSSNHINLHSLFYWHFIHRYSSPVTNNVHKI